MDRPDYLEANLSHLRQRQPELITLLSELSHEEVRIGTSKTGLATLALAQDSHLHHLASRYDPAAEAARFVDQLTLPETGIVVVVGIGCGYHLLELDRRLNKEVSLIAVGLYPAIVRAALEAVDWSSLFESDRPFRLVVGENPLSCGGQVEQLVPPRQAGQVDCVLYSTCASLYALKRDAFLGDMETRMRRLHGNWITEQSFGPLWEENLVRNLFGIAHDPGIRVLKGAIEGGAAIVVGSGPSLAGNMHLLKQARGRLPIVAAASAYRYLSENGVQPDMVVTVDPQEDTRSQFDGLDVPESLWLVYFPIAFPAIVSRFRQRLAACFRDAFSTWLDERFEAKGLLFNGGTVTATALDVCRFMGAADVGLIGLDLAYSGMRPHAGEPKIDGGLPGQGQLESIPGDYVQAQDLFGSPVWTNEAMLTYRTVFERYLSFHSALRVFNCTEGGLALKGAPGMSLEHFLFDHRHDRPRDIHEVLDGVRRPEPAVGKDALAAYGQELRQFLEVSDEIAADPDYSAVESHLKCRPGILATMGRTIRVAMSRQRFSRSEFKDFLEVQARSRLKWLEEAQS